MKKVLFAVALLSSAVVVANEEAATESTAVRSVDLSWLTEEEAVVYNNLATLEEKAEFLAKLHKARTAVASNEAVAEVAAN